ncbi:hypothetical protein [Archangium lansingense]|uniref:Uncharacterized protein n=1 Tax=Archangium lansingense TaxID=2995310 RepID=A0ABT4AM36_9BACT|nr:hypothetical protein [Archangium lansinium]MCY1082745.1 hypothetical protein [Archangium lansinium]
MKKIALCMGLALWTLTVSPPAAAQSAACTTTDGSKVVNGLLSSLTPVLNKTWPSLAVDLGLDPMKDVYEGPIKLGCKYGGHEICAAQAASCEDMWADVDVSSINGLAYMQFEDLAVTKLQAASGTQVCPFNSKASGGSYSCSYSGMGAGNAYLIDNSQISATLSKIKVKVKCNLGGFAYKWTETVYSGKAKCYGNKPSGNATLNFCAGTCASGSAPATLAYSAVDKLDIQLSGLSCDVSPDYNPVSWVAEVLAPALESTIVKKITPPIKDALNDLLKDQLPFPTKCGP